MDLSTIAPIIEEIIKETLEERRYPFGFSKFKGVGNKVASGRLRNSVSVSVQQNKQDIQILQVYMEDYWQWVQSGRLPGKKGVPIGSIEQWIKERGLKGRNKKGKYITNRSFAFAIQHNIKRFGIRPSNFLDIALDRIIKDTRITDLLGEAAYEELINLIEGI